MTSHGVPQRINLKRDDVEKLQHLSDLLHLFYHRNNNQHRRSVWWRHFSIFRKQVNTFVTDVQALHIVPETHLARTKKKASDPIVRRQLEQRTKFWQDALIPKWHRAFSQVAADGRFAVLGLVLGAVLAELCNIIGITATYEDLGQAEVESVLHRFAKEDWNDDGTHASSPTQRGEDVGELLQREADGSDRDAAITGQKRGRSPSAKPTFTAAGSRIDDQVALSRPTPKTTKKKRRKGNAIDNLFSGLG